MPQHADLGSAALLRLALETFRADVLPALPSERRYAGAMTGNALEIALRGLAPGAVDGDRLLLDPLYGEGKGDMALLARDIRAGRLDDRSHDSLRGLLKEQIRRELTVRNPRFLASRQA
jgi:hypothetical protein